MSRVDIDERASTAVETAMIDHRDAMGAFERSSTPPAAGAVVCFAGVVRDHDEGRAVRELEYVGHPTAADVLDRVAREVAGRHPAAVLVRMAHRTGLLAIGDVALFAEVAAAHRAEAFAACADLVDEVKRVLPVWKRQVFPDGTDEWVNSP
jgi:molybdopterin synthase catalytic subunit